MTPIVFSHIILSKKCFREQLLNYDVTLLLDLTLRDSEETDFSSFSACDNVCTYACMCLWDCSTQRWCNWVGLHSEPLDSLCICRDISVESAHTRAHFKAHAFSHWARARPVCFKGTLAVLYHPLSDRHSWLSLSSPFEAIRAHGGGINGSLDWVWMLSDFVRGFPPDGRGDCLCLLASRLSGSSVKEENLFLRLSVLCHCQRQSGISRKQ